VTWPTWAESVGFAAFLLNVWGNWLMTKRDARGWWVRIACNFVQLAYAALILSPSLVVSAVVFLGINVKGIVEWRRPRAAVDGSHAPWCALRRGAYAGYPIGGSVPSSEYVCNCGRLA
jgi:hypothetical protein